MTSACREFQEWLDSLPAGELTGRLMMHMESCEKCRAEYALLGPVVAALAEAPMPEGLDEEKIERFAAAAEKEAFRKANRKLAFRMLRNLLVSLPFVGALNWVWFKLGSTLLAEFVSSYAALVYSIMLLVSVSLTAALILGSIPLLWGRFRHSYQDKF